MLELAKLKIEHLNFPKLWRTSKSKENGQILKEDHDREKKLQWRG